MCGRQPWAEEGEALLEKAAGQGHAYAMKALGHIHRVREEDEQAVQWFTKGAEAGLPDTMYDLAVSLDNGKGMAAADYPAAADWYRRAAEAGHGGAAFNLSHMHTTGRGVPQKKKEAMRWRRKVGRCRLNR